MKRVFTIIFIFLFSQSIFSGVKDSHFPGNDCQREFVMDKGDVMRQNAEFMFLKNSEIHKKNNFKGEPLKAGEKESGSDFSLTVARSGSATVSAMILGLFAILVMIGLVRKQGPL